MELFLDCNAHQNINEKALKAFIEFNSSVASRGHALSPSLPGRSASLALEEARSKIASLIGAGSPNNIIITSGATQSAEWAMEILYDLLGGGAPLISPIEHPSIIQAYNKYFGSEEYFNYNKNGKYIENNKYEAVVCIHCQNETGLIQPINNIECDLLLSDITQSVGKIPINLNNMDITIFGAHKFGGFGCGFIYLKNPKHWKKFGTGSRYQLDRTGTPDVASVVASAVALEDAINTFPTRTKNMIEFRTILENELKKLGIEIIADEDERSPNTTFIRVPDKALYIMMKLENNGIYVGLGSACGSLTSNINPMMERLNRNCSANDFIRISQWGNYSEKEARYLVEHIKQLI